jgi:hypothetical protein
VTVMSSKEWACAVSFKTARRWAGEKLGFNMA